MDSAAEEDDDDVVHISLSREVSDISLEGDPSSKSSGTGSSKSDAKDVTSGLSNSKRTESAASYSEADDSAAYSKEYSLGSLRGTDEAEGNVTPVNQEDTFMSTASSIPADEERRDHKDSALSGDGQDNAVMEERKEAGEEEHLGSVKRSPLDGDDNSSSMSSTQSTDVTSSSISSGQEKSASPLDLGNATESEADKSIGVDDSKKPSEEDRVLIERGGKFELVDRKEIKDEYFDMLGIPTPREEPPKESKPPRIRSSPTKRQQSAGATRTMYKNPELSHIKSRYEMSDAQKQMKHEHSSAIKARKDEEARRKKEQEEERIRNAEKCFEAWISAKSESAKKGARLKKAAENDQQDEKKKELAQKAYDGWLQEKKKQKKYEQLIEKARAEDEAYDYDVHDRDMCDRAFRSWLRKKNSEKKSPSLKFGQAIQHPKPKPKARSMQRSQSTGVKRMQSYPSSGYPQNNHYREPWQTRFNSKVD